MKLALPDADTHFQNLWESPERRHFRLIYRSGMLTGIDVGAHVGTWIDNLRKMSRIVAFEPQPANFACLLENFPDLEAHNVALSDREGTGSLVTPAPENTGAWELGPGGEVPVTTLDSFNLTNVGVIKIDVQGSEAAVLRGARKTIMRWSPTIFIEVIMNDALDLETVHELHELGYTKGHLHGRDLITVKDDLWPYLT